MSFAAALSCHRFPPTFDECVLNSYHCSCADGHVLQYSPFALCTMLNQCQVDCCATPYLPEQIHLSITDNIEEMVVMWSTLQVCRVVCGFVLCLCLCMHVHVHVHVCLRVFLCFASARFIQPSPDHLPPPTHTHTTMQKTPAPVVEYGLSSDNLNLSANATVSTYSSGGWQGHVRACNALPSLFARSWHCPLQSLAFASNPLAHFPCFHTHARALLRPLFFCLCDHSP